MSAPLSTPFETLTRGVFHALMQALSHPGRPQLPPPAANLHEALVCVGRTLLDLETSYFTNDGALAQRLGETGARALPAAAAEYHFYAHIDDAALGAISEASVGSHADPEGSACIIAGAMWGTAGELHISGPGVKDTNCCIVRGVPAAFWDLRTQRLDFPLGWDVFLLTADGVVGLPRTVLVEVGIV